MSIINEALKKTQEKLKVRTALQHDPAAPKEETRFLPWITSTFILGCFLGSSLVYFFFIHIKTGPLLTSTTKQNQESSLETKSPELSLPVSAPETKLPAAAIMQPQNNLVVNGIVTMGNDRYALINNEIYRVGDFIEDKQVVSISEDKVQILDQGNIRTLSTKSNR